MREELLVLARFGAMQQELGERGRFHPKRDEEKLAALSPALTSQSRLFFHFGI
jgi:hypothetical protein